MISQRSHFSLAILILLLLCTWFASSLELYAARIGDIETSHVWAQAKRFFALEDPSLQIVLFGCLLLGLNCGVLGTFVVERRMSLIGDTLSHAVLPGIAVAFLISLSKNPLFILAGALSAGLLAVLTITAITRTTKLKTDAAMGMVLASFYAVGICLITMIQRIPSGQKSGVDKFLFGQAAALSSQEITLLAITTVSILLFSTLLFRGLLVLSFHREYGQTLGLPMRTLHVLMMILIAFAVITAMQAVGVILVSALLILPATTAGLWSDRLKTRIILAGCIGMVSTSMGAFLSFLDSNLPTGPLMILSGCLILIPSLLLSPKQGWVLRWIQKKSRRAKTEREDTLKSMYHVLEDRQFHGECVSLLELAQRRQETLDHIQQRARNLCRAHLIQFRDDQNSLIFTAKGLQRAKALVRNHRLWELYLTQVLRYPHDHVHDDAEKIEHVLGEDMVRDLERQLGFPATDPHGKEIPKVPAPSFFPSHKSP